MTQNAPRHNDTIVLGAGMSGIACAARLFQEQARSKKTKGKLLVLETRDRIGGRIGSVHVNGCRLDTGANWIHGIGTDEKPNPLMKILPHKKYRQLSGSVVFRPPPPSEEDGKAADSDEDGWQHVKSTSGATKSAPIQLVNGDLVIPPHTAGTLMSTMWGLFDSLHDTATSTPADKAKDTTMLKAIAASPVFQEAFDKVAPEYHQALRALPQFIENMEAAPLVAQSAEGKADTPGMGLLEYVIDDFDGDQVFLRDGYTAVVEELGRELVEAGLVELGVEVETIEWEKDPITVKTKCGETYTAKDVICTLPLGVLKERQTSAAVPPLFQPKLPAGKREAIASLGFGTLDKIFMVYSSAWWTEEPFSSLLHKGLVSEPITGSDSGLASRQEEEADIFMGFTPSLPGLEIHSNGSTSPGLRVLSIANLHSLTGLPALSCFISCSNARSMEPLPDSHARDLIHNTLTTWLGHEPPKPEGVHVTRWGQDEFSRGSYSHMITGVSETEHRVEFQTPVEVKGGGRLRFAGEHTSRNHFATVHGALISGWREADAVLEGT
ncbi:hypothetical protein LTR37_008068 [Vermiconidia calcicola]|uniref:Uncharacterized protein n=1 Tax=Vermiconidia calcicola TaxID=1690605 RepID=A0ACC3NDF9_9PEZI|nr:hypothetical protein LTR37_008068 [Vermiconidia calcicola]